MISWIVIAAVVFWLIVLTKLVTKTISNQDGLTKIITRLKVDCFAAVDKPSTYSDEAGSVIVPEPEPEKPKVVKGYEK